MTILTPMLFDIIEPIFEVALIVDMRFGARRVVLYISWAGTGVRACRKGAMEQSLRAPGEK